MEKKDEKKDEKIKNQNAGAKTPDGNMAKEENKIKEPQNQLDEIRKKSEEYLNGWKRERAELLNYKNEEAQRMGQLMKYASQELILKIIPILDNFEIAEKHIPDETKKDEHVKGILQISKQIKDLLRSQGIEEIKTVGEAFNPNFHESVAEVEVKDGQHDIIVEEARKGYTIGGRVLRPAKVKVVK